ncbi:MAG: GDSL-type esterase/lipase family protein [Clostridiales bacterium]|jgi:lysophospholipase L1-like esterase|nr:GDSL-type esterase/lipase family protein [Clostridiales bacterium]
MAIFFIVLLAIALVALLSAVIWFLKYLDGFVAEERRSRIIGFSLMNKDARPGQVVFVGDSITDGFRVSEFFEGFASRTGKSTYNRGISGEFSNEMLSRFEDNILSLKPSCVVILMGTNDLHKKTAPADIAGNIEETLAMASRQGVERVILQAVYPVNTTKGGKVLSRTVGKGRTVERIAELNSLLEKAASKHGAVWLDLSKELSSAPGVLNPDYSFDGLHLTAAGYAVVAGKIEPLLV